MRKRLDPQNRIRREATARLRRTISAIQEEARERGLTAEEAERLVCEDTALPLKPLVPNAETIKAMKEARRGGLKSYHSVEDLMKSLHDDD